MKNVLSLGIIGSLVYLISRASGAQRISDRSVVRTLNTRISKITLQGITVATDIAVDNPTNTAVRVTKPVVTVTTSGTYIASSIPSRTVFTIAPLSQTSLGTTEIDLNWSSLTPYISGLVAQLRALIGKSNIDAAQLNLPRSISEWRCLGQS